MNMENVEKLKVTTQNSLALKSCSIMDFRYDCYTSAIEILDIRLPHSYILGINHFGGKKNEIFLSRKK